jgi:hypothetical protein
MLLEEFKGVDLVLLVWIKSVFENENVFVFSFRDVKSRFVVFDGWFILLRLLVQIAHPIIYFI